MAAPNEPSDGAVDQVVMVTGLQPGDAIKWLKLYNSDVNKAADAYFENPNAILDQQSQVRKDEQRDRIWDEDHFHTGKTNDVHAGQNDLGVRPADTLNPGVFNDSAPTRPPSRVSTRMTTAANGANQNVTMESEDEEMKKAVALSLGKAPQQEVGVSEHKGFGPAKRPHYEAEKWALTVAGPQIEEILLNPEPGERKRPEGSPAFLKPAPAGHRLPALLTILHAIPMAREALLNRSYMLPDYGHDKDWWDGIAIKQLRIVNLDLDGRQINNDDIMYETQRLMALLDDTKRAYGSVDVLADIDSLGKNNDNKVLEFLNEWHAATTRFATGAPLINIFQSKGMKIFTDGSDDPRTHTFPALTMWVNDQLSGKGLTLYELVDQTLWPDIDDEDEVFLETVGDVFTLEVRNQVTGVTGLGIEIPAVWYADRYLRSSTKQVQDMLYRKKKVDEALEHQEKAQTSMTHFAKPGNGETVDTLHLLSKASAYFDETTAYRDAIQKRSGALEDFQAPDRTSSSTDRVAEELKALAARISQKLKGFEELRESTREKLKEVSQLYTKPSDNPAQPPYHKYTLRGVSTTPNTVYVLEKTKLEDRGDILSMEAQDWQWWKIAFVINEAKPVVRIKVKEEDVLKAASTESSNALLIYANERATSYKSENLPPQLHNFVRTDNLYFSTELDGSTTPNPATPTKRKVDDNDSDDLETHYHRSPPHDRNLVDIELANDDMDFDPPDYYSKPVPRPQSHQNTNPYRATTIRSSDDVIPISLQNPAPGFIDPASRILNGDGTGESQEMQERGGRGLLYRQKGGKEEYSLGNYVPEINMVDDEEDENQRGVKGG